MPRTARKQPDDFMPPTCGKCIDGGLEGEDLERFNEVRYTHYLSDFPNESSLRAHLKQRVEYLMRDEDEKERDAAVRAVDSVIGWWRLARKRTSREPEPKPSRNGPTPLAELMDEAYQSLVRTYITSRATSGLAPDPSVLASMETKYDSMRGVPVG